MTDTPQLVERLQSVGEYLQRIANWRDRSAAYTDSRNIPRRPMNEAQIIHIEGEARQALKELAVACDEITLLQSKLDRLSLPGGEREAIIAWLREAADSAHMAQANASANNDKTAAEYWRGHKDSLNIAAIAIERGEGLSQPRPEPSMDDVERVAAAIHEARYDPRFEREKTPFDQEDASGQEYCRRLARAALQSLPQAGEREAIEAELTANIVAWLRNMADTLEASAADVQAPPFFFKPIATIRKLAAAIECGDHLTQPAEGER